MADQCNWDKLTKEELVHLIDGDKEVESLILLHLIGNIKGQRDLHTNCYICESAAKKLGVVVNVGQMTKLESLRLIRWLLNRLDFSDDSLNKAQGLLLDYNERR